MTNVNCVTPLKFSASLLHAFSRHSTKERNQERDSRDTFLLLCFFLLVQTACQIQQGKESPPFKNECESSAYFIHGKIILSCNFFYPSCKKKCEIKCFKKMMHLFK